MKWSNRSPLRVALLDDHPLIRNGFAMRMQPERDIEVVALYASSREMLQALSSTSIDVLVLDYSLQPHEVDGLNLIRLLAVRYPAMRLLVSSASELPAIVALSLRTGASGFIGKSQGLDELLRAIRQVGSGKVYLQPGIEPGQRQAAVSGEPASAERAQTLAATPGLSAREQEVLRCCLEGMSVSQIASKFNRSVKTISAQKIAAFRKLGIRNDIELFKVDGGLGPC